MSDYSKSTNFTAKDTLPTGNAGKIIKGTEFDTEFTNIASAISSKADASSPSLLGSPTAPTATAGSNTTQIANTAYVKTAVDNIGTSLSSLTTTWAISTTGNAATATTCTGNAATVTNGVYTNAANSFSNYNYFNNLTYFGGTNNSNSSVLSNSSINFYSSITGNLYNSIYYATSSTALVDQQYTINFKNPSAASAVAAFILSGDGGAYKTGGGSWGSVSDARLKTNAVPLTGALNKINELNPVTYSWRYDTTEPTVGFIAQEVQQVIPNAISSHVPNDQEKPFIDDRTLSIGWQNDMTAYLVGAINFQICQI
jgi:hypothetical protein